MNLRKALSPDSVALCLKSTTKDDLIQEMLDMLMQTGKVKDRERALESVRARENKLSTGMKNGIAIPHGKTDAVDSLVAGIGISERPVDFGAMDGLACRIFIMTLSPLSRTGPHLQFLAEISRLFKSEERRAAILAAHDPKTVWALLCDQESGQ
jgi:PTS system nitrogen regulatory IIA component